MNRLATPAALMLLALASFTLGYSCPARAAHEKTWAMVLNQANAGADAEGVSDYQVWFAKSVAIGTGTGLTFVNQAGTGVTPTGVWTVSGSSPGDGTSNMAGTDTWTTTFDATKIVHATAGTNHSWIALAQGSWKWWIDCNSATTSTCATGFGYGSYTGGTATARPTITTAANAGEFVGTNMSTLQWNDTSGAAHKVHGLLATDGSFWIYSSKNGSAFFWFALGSVFLTNTPSWNPTFNLWTVARYSATGPVLTQAGPGGTPPIFGAANMFTRFGRASTSAQCVWPATNNGGTQIVSGGTAAANFIFEPDPSGGAFQWPFHVMAQDSTANRSDYVGRVPDFSFCNTTRADGDVTPSSGNYDYTVVGDFLGPWGTGTAPSL
jgi:hypothetical protein